MNPPLIGRGLSRPAGSRTTPLLTGETFWQGFSIGMAVHGARQIVDGYDNYEPEKAAEGLKNLAFSSKAVPALPQTVHTAAGTVGCGLWGALAFHEMAKGQRDEDSERKAWGLGGVLCATGFMLKGLGGWRGPLASLGGRRSRAVDS